MNDRDWALLVYQLMVFLLACVIIKVGEWQAIPAIWWIGVLLGGFVNLTMLVHTVTLWRRLYRKA